MCWFKEWIHIFHYKLAIEVYEFSYCGRNIYFERKRQKAIEQNRGSVFMKIDADKK